MAEQNSPQEQSMEEILASIRRIISENSDAEQTGKKSNSKGYDEVGDVVSEFSYEWSLKRKF